MMPTLPINLESLLYRRTIENERAEHQTSSNPNNCMEISESNAGSRIRAVQSIVSDNLANEAEAPFAPAFSKESA